MQLDTETDRALAAAGLMVLLDGPKSYSVLAAILHIVYKTTGHQEQRARDVTTDYQCRQAVCFC